MISVGRELRAIELSDHIVAPERFGGDFRREEFPASIAIDNNREWSLSWRDGELQNERKGSLALDGYAVSLK